MKNNKGITLISLVVTVIVLIILATVSITTISGNNGIIKSTIDVKGKAQIAEMDENLQVNMLILYDKYLREKSAGSFLDYLEANQDKLKSSLGVSGSNFVFDKANGKITYNGQTYSVAEDGTVTNDNMLQ